MTPGRVPDNCSLCPRLVAYRRQNQAACPDWHNRPVRSVGSSDSRVLILGLAPGVSGANRTGVPFTGDGSGDLLFATMAGSGFLANPGAVPAGNIPALTDCVLTNAVRCVPPKNRPTAGEVNTCRQWLSGRISRMSRLRAILCLGKIAHDSMVRALGLRLADHPFSHGARHDAGKYVVFDSYHCSRYNINTRRLTPAMFEAVFADLRQYTDNA